MLLLFFFNCLPLILVLSSVTSYIALSRLGKMNCKSTECYIRLCRQVKLTEYKRILSAAVRFVSHRLLQVSTSLTAPDADVALLYYSKESEGRRYSFL